MAPANPASPSPGPAGAASGPGSFPPLNGPNGTASSNAGAPPSDAQRTLQSLAGLTGTTVTVSLRNGPRYEGVVSSTSPEGDIAGVTLKDARDVNIPGAPIKDRQFIAATNIANWTSGPADAKPPPANGDCE
jgi:hypothetical protein